MESGENGNVERRLVTAQRIQDLDIRLTRMEEKALAHDAAVLLAKAEIDRRLREMNQMREQINMERGSFLQRAEYEEKYKVISEKIDQRAEIVDGKLNDLKNFQYLIIGGLAVFQVLVGIAAHYWRGG